MIPKKFTAFGRKWSVKICKLAPDKDGHIDFKSGIIKIDIMDEFLQERAFYHEYSHLLFYHLRSKYVDDEAACDLVGQLIQEFMNTYQADVRQF